MKKSMVIQHNMIANFTQRELKLSMGDKSKSTEKLASGYRINRAADDAAGLSISEKMRSQIRGLRKASNNIQDGISLIQVADGALQETTEVLQRMRELSVQAANDTNTTADRTAIQDEIDALRSEIDRIAKDTSFNEGIYPLSGVSKSTTNLAVPNYIKEVTIQVQKDPDSMGDVRVEGRLLGDGETALLHGLQLSYGSSDSFTSPGEIIWGNDNENSTSTPHLLQASDDGYDYQGLRLSDLKISESGKLYFTNKFYKEDYYLLEDKENKNLTFAFDENDESFLPEGMYYIYAEKTGDLWIQSGALGHQGIKIDLVDATVKGIGLGDVDVSSFENAGKAISNVDEALSVVSGYRSKFGALQNRLEHAKKVDDNTEENTQYAESRIRDTDMTDEMVNFSKHSIVEQVGQSMLAQANNSTQGVLSLLG